MDRDPKSGHFLEGNKVAVGNKGNRNPKWGNKNAKVHGFFETYIVPRIKDDGTLILQKRGSDPVHIKPEGYLIDEKGLWLRNDVKEAVEELGFVFYRW